jgi:hypothetical protein
MCVILLKKYQCSTDSPTLYIECVLSVDTTQHEDKCIIFINLNLNYYNVYALVLYLVFVL